MITVLLSTMLLAATVNPFADMTQAAVDSNTALYQGTELSYVFGAPQGYRLVLEEAALQGLSLAFVPEDEGFDTADVMIAVTIYRIEGNGVKFDRVVAEDTSAIRAHYDGSVDMWAVDSVFTGGFEIIPTVYVNDDTRFVPTVMVSYYDGGAEIVIFELAISDRFPRFKAEKIYEEAMLRFKTLRQGDPSRINLGKTDTE